MPIRPENRGRYPEDWVAISRRVRFARAGGRCECDGRCSRGHDGRCAVEDRDKNAEGARLFLTVAHLNHTPEDNREENLMAMCPGCHLHYDIPHHEATRRAREERELLEAGQLQLGLVA